jgi:hypothetical protein
MLGKAKRSLVLNISYTCTLFHPVQVNESAEHGLKPPNSFSFTLSPRRRLCSGLQPSGHGPFSPWTSLASTPSLVPLAPATGAYLPHLKQTKHVSSLLAASSAQLASLLPQHSQDSLFLP